MRIFKSILILALLISISCSVLGMSNTEIADLYWPKEVDTLFEWFRSRTLDEKVEIYNWWKYESVNLKIVNDPFGDITIRIDKDDERLEKEAINQTKWEGFWKENRREKHITHYSENDTWEDPFGLMSVEILNVKPYIMATEIDKIYKLIGSENISGLFLHDNEIQIRIWIDGKDVFERLRAIKDKLMENGFEYQIN